MKQIITILFSVIAVAGFAKENKIKEVNTKEFPKVSLIWNCYGNADLNLKNFMLTENGTKVEIEDLRIEQPVIPNTAKSVIFLWEDNGNWGQYLFLCSRNILNKLFSDDDEDVGTKYCVMVFSSVQEKKVRLITDNFVSKNAALNEVKSYERLGNAYYVSDLKPAINKAYDLARNESPNVAKAIFILTAGNISSDLSFYAVELSRLRTPVYIVDLYVSQKNEYLKELEEKTAGDIIPVNVNNDDSWTNTKKQIRTAIDNLHIRHYGYDYKITFTSNQKRNKTNCDLKLIVQGELDEKQYTTPGFSLKVFVRNNMIIAVIILLATIAAIIALSVWGSNAWRNRQARKKGNRETNKKRRQDTEKQVQENREEIEKLKDDRRRELMERKRANANAIDAEQEAKMLRLMQNKQLFPTLNIMGKQTYDIKVPVTTIGRDKNNDVILPQGSVSGQHAQIIFNGAEFEIYDLKSTNGLFVNDIKVDEKQVLNNGDKIQFTYFEKIIIRFDL